MTFEEFWKIQCDLESKMESAAAKIRSYDHLKNSDGSTPDSLKFSPQYVADKTAFKIAFAELRDFNHKHLASFKKEHRARMDFIREQKRQARG